MKRIITSTTRRWLNGLPLRLALKWSLKENAHE